MRLARTLLTALLPVLTGCSYVGARGLDFFDCVRGVTGVGFGLAVDAQVTDYLSPGLGVATYTWNYGWFDREIHGAWIESDVINTPRLAYEAIAEEFDASGRDQLDQNTAVAQLALSSLNLPNERWIRRGGVVRVEYYALFNFFGVAEQQRAWWLADLLVQPGDIVLAPEKSMWQRAWIEVGVTAVVLHVRAGLNPLEMLDFAAGWFGLDPAGDDDREPFYRLRPLERDRDAPFWER